ncbi:MAG: hypothetical protein QOG58_4621 [Caballeronia sp.]|nr:hypothetical protein [Caballeronia sp.]
MKHALKNVLAVLIVAGFAAPAVSFADMHRDNRHAPVRHHVQPHHPQPHHQDNSHR